MIKNFIAKLLYKAGYKITKRTDADNQKFHNIYQKFFTYTMITKHHYHTNLLICAKYVERVEGDVVECGVWKGGMIAGIAELLGNKRNYYLFDSFEGLPPVKDIDGQAAKSWQTNTVSEAYYDNCAADISFAAKAMSMTNCKHQLVKGWFNDTLPGFNFPGQIALLRLDGDWYDSTMECLVNLFPKVANNGVIIIDDYSAWEGCSKAVHDYLSQIKSASKIYSLNGVSYIIKVENN